MWTVDWEDEFVVGGDGNRRLTPSFRLKEFRRPDGTVRVHRELVSGLQLLRDRFGKPLSVRSTDPDGLGAVVSGEPLTELANNAVGMRERRLFESVSTQQDGVKVTIPASGQLHAIDLEQALETAFLVTAAFETAGDKFQQVTGNFDGAGLSFGPAQVNFGTGTLVPLFRKFKAADPSALRNCFTDEDDYDDWLRVMDLPKAEQIEWANSVSTGRGGHDVVEPWKSYFRAVGRVETYRADHGREHLERLWRQDGARGQGAARPDTPYPDRPPAVHLLALRSGGSARQPRQGVVRDRGAGEAGEPKDQFELTRIAVVERGGTALPQWRADAISRRVGILNGVPETVDDRQRANINFYMLRDVRVGTAVELSSGDLHVVRVSQAVASGNSLLA